VNNQKILLKCPQWQGGYYELWVRAEYDPNPWMHSSHPNVDAALAAASSYLGEPMALPLVPLRELVR
jgi:hypothetical protein